MFTMGAAAEKRKQHHHQQQKQQRGGNLQVSEASRGSLAMQQPCSAAQRKTCKGPGAIIHNVGLVPNQGAGEGSGKQIKIVRGARCGARLARLRVGFGSCRAQTRPACAAPPAGLMHSATPPRMHWGTQFPPGADALRAVAAPPAGLRSRCFNDGAPATACVRCTHGASSTFSSAPVVVTAAVAAAAAAAACAVVVFGVDLAICVCRCERVCERACMCVYVCVCARAVCWFGL